MQRLKQKKDIDRLFKEGRIKYGHDLLLRYIFEKQSEGCCFGVSVSKSKFKRAVDRNRIKRQLREAIKRVSLCSFSGKAMLIYTGTTLPKTQDIIEECVRLFRSIDQTFE